MVVTAGLIVLATLAGDFITCGASVADDPASLAAAGFVLSRGLAMIGAATATLPVAASAASVDTAHTIQLTAGR